MANKIAGPRIGTGRGYFVLGWISLLVGLALSIGVAMADGSGSSLGGGLLFLAFGFFAVGFWVRLFGLVERRLIDVQKDLQPGAEVVERPSTAVIDLTEHF